MTVDARPHVLVIEDDEDVAAMMKVTLRRAGYDVEVAYDGPAGLAAARHRRPDVILLDLRMAPMDGFEVMAQLRDDESLADVPVVVASILAEEERVRKAGATVFVKKPFAHGAISAAIEQARAAG